MKNMEGSSYNDKLDRLDRCAGLKKVDRVPIQARPPCICPQNITYSSEDMYSTGKIQKCFCQICKRVQRTQHVCSELLKQSHLAYPWQGLIKAKRSKHSSSLFRKNVAHDITEKDNYSSHPGREIPSDTIPIKNQKSGHDLRRV